MDEGPVPISSRPLLATPEEARRELRIAKSTLYGLLAAGELESLTLGRARRIPWSSIDALVARRSQRVGA